MILIVVSFLHTDVIFIATVCISTPTYTYTHEFHIDTDKRGSTLTLHRDIGTRKNSFRYKLLNNSVSENRRKYAHKTRRISDIF